MQYRLARALVIAVMVTTSAWTARAEGQDDGATEPRAPSAEDRMRASFLLDRAAVAYRLGRHADAIVLLEEAYVLSEEPILLYNLGRAYEAAGDEERALGAYHRYLEVSADAPNAVAVLETIGAIEARQAEAIAREAAAVREAQEAQAALEEAERARIAAQRAEDERRAREAQQEREMFSATGWSIAGLGALTLAGGAIAGALALERRDDAIAAEDLPGTVSALGDARDLATGANVAFVVGGLLVAGGATWAIYELLDTNDERSASVAVLPGGLELRGTF